jgi:hypothetical protein
MFVYLKKSTSIMKFSTALLTAFVLYIGYQIFGAAMYTYHLVDFYELDYDISEHGLVINGNQNQFGALTSVSALSAQLIHSEHFEGQQYTCDHVKSKRGTTTMSEVGGELVCCWTSSNQQWHIPFKDISGERHYLCGAWPHLDRVIMPIENIEQMGLN